MSYNKNYRIYDRIKAGIPRCNRNPAKGRKKKVRRISWASAKDGGRRKRSGSL